MRLINVLNDSIRFLNNHMGDSTVEGICDSIDEWFMNVDVDHLTSFQHIAYTELNDVLFNYYKSLWESLKTLSIVNTN